MLPSNLFRWLRDVDNAFPREFGLGRKVVNSFGELEVELDTANYRDAYCAIFGRWQLSNNDFDTIYIDIEAGRREAHDDILQAYENMQHIIDVITPSRLYFTGRGFAAFYDLKEHIYERAYYHAVCQNFLERLKIKQYVDAPISGDARRVARIPSTQNSKTDYWMIQISPDMTIREILKNAQKRIHEDFIGPKLTLSADVLNVEIPRGVEVEYKHLIDEVAYPLCIKNAILSLKTTGELDAVERLHWATFMIMNGETEKAREILRDYASDYKTDYTNYQLTNIVRKGYKCYKCANVPKTICPFTNIDDCEYSPSINIQFRKDDNGD